jgi:hypothetical protein
LYTVSKGRSQILQPRLRLQKPIHLAPNRMERFKKTSIPTGRTFGYQVDLKRKPVFCGVSFIAQLQSIHGGPRSTLGFRLNIFAVFLKRQKRFCIECSCVHRLSTCGNMPILYFISLKTYNRSTGDGPPSLGNSVLWIPEFPGNLDRLIIFGPSSEVLRFGSFELIVILFASIGIFGQYRNWNPYFEMRLLTTVARLGFICEP